MKPLPVTRYHTARRERLGAFLKEIAQEHCIGPAAMARAIEHTAPPGWPLDLGAAPTFEHLAEALEDGDVFSDERP